MPWETIRAAAFRCDFRPIQAFTGCWFLNLDDQDDFHDALKLISSSLAQRQSDLPQFGMWLSGYIPIEHQAPECLVLILEVLVLIFQFNHALAIRG